MAGDKSRKLTRSEIRYRIALRERLVAERGEMCEMCGKRKSEHMHHRTYINLGKEKPEDIKLMCKPCHMALHKRSKAWKLTIKDIPFSHPDWESSIRNNAQPEYINETHTNEAGMSYNIRRKNPKVDKHPSPLTQLWQRLRRKS